MSTLSKVLVGLAITFGVILVITRVFLFEIYRIPSDSMYPTLPNGSLVVVKKFGATPPQRGEIIVFKVPSNEEVNYMFRVVALPGDQVSYRDRRLTINAQTLPLAEGRRDERYQYASEQMDNAVAQLAFILERPSRDYIANVPAVHYVVFGDNRDNARDSRYIGFIPEGNVVGKVVHVL